MKKYMRTRAISMGAILLLIGWLSLQMRTNVGPDSVWHMAHIFLLLGYVAIFIGGINLYVSLGSVQSKLILASKYLGLSLFVVGMIAFTAQVVIDFIAGFLSTDQSGMDQVFNAVHDQLAAHLAFYTVGPALFYIGLLIIVAVATKVHQLSLLHGVVAVVGISLIGIAFSLSPGDLSSPLYPLGLVCLASGFLSIHRNVKS